jgi:photosystem II stability/assembly factor-like uncharacterized protein
MKARHITTRPLDRILLMAIAIVAMTTTARAQLEWKPANEGLQGGRVSSFVFDSSSGNVYAGSVCDLFRFDRATSRWVVEAKQLPARLLATTRSGVLLVCSDSTTHRIASSGAVPELVQTLGQMTSIAVSSSGTLVAFVMPRYLLRSTDDGRTWGIIDSISLQPSRGRHIIDDPDGIFYSYGGEKLLTRSIDDGVTWDTLPAIVSSGFVRVVSFGGGRMIALGADINGRDSLYRSTDTGTTWSATLLPFSHPNKWEIGPGKAIHAIALDGQLYRSTDEGVRWSNLGTVDRDATLGIAPSGDIWIGRKGRIIRSPDQGSSWEDRTEGFMALHVPQIVSDSVGRLFAIAGGQTSRDFEQEGSYSRLDWGSLYHSLDGGKSWSVLLPNTKEISGSLDNGMLYVSSRTSPGITYSRDNGETWDSIGSSIIDFGGVDDNANGKIVMTFVPREGVAPVSEIAVSSDRGRTWSRSTLDGSWYEPTVLETGRILIRRSIDNTTDLMSSTDDGVTWQVSIQGIIIRDIQVKRNGEIFLVGTSRGKNVYVIYRSTDGGATWELRHEFLPMETKGGYLLLTRRGDIILKHTRLRSRDDGDTWDSTGAREVPDRFEVIDTPDGTFYAYTPAVAQWIFSDYGIQVRSPIYRSTDNGDTWTRHDGPVPIHGTIAMAITPSGKMFVGTNGCGIYTDGKVSRVAATRPAPLGLAIDAVGPNPVSGKTVARINVAAQQEVRVTLSDIQGTEIAVLHNGVVEAGGTDIAFDVSGLASGSYLLTLRGADGIVSARLVVHR